MNGLPIWLSLKFNDTSSLDKLENAIWKNPKNGINGDWMIGEMEDRENPKIRGITGSATRN